MYVKVKCKDSIVNVKWKTDMGFQRCKATPFCPLFVRNVSKFDVGRVISYGTGQVEKGRGTKFESKQLEGRAKFQHNRMQVKNTNHTNAVNTA